MLDGRHGHLHFISMASGVGMSRFIAYLSLSLAGILSLIAPLSASAKPVSPLDGFYTLRPEDVSGKLEALSAEQDLGHRFLSYHPDTRQPWQGILASNTPSGASIGVPILIAQGEEDSLVRPNVTTDFVRALCREGKSVSYITLPQVDHGMSAAAAVSWMDSRFKGAHPASNCGK
jgi:pimeloyl-ACP methyl ester carboxylesterase